MKIGILTNEVFDNSPLNSVASSRIRANWLIKYWEDAELFKVGRKYDVTIYQKAYNIRQAPLNDGIKILDLCDAEWHVMKPVMQMASYCDAVVVSTQPLKDYLKKFFPDKPIVVIPDRMDLEHHTQQKKHEGEAKTAVWYGYKGNHIVLDQVLNALNELKLGLIVISESPFVINQSIYPNIELTNYVWSIDTVNADIIKGDIVLNPRFEHGKWRFKSNNKTITAWALGMPVANTREDLERLLPVHARIEEANTRLIEIREKYDVRQSVSEYKEFIATL